MIPVTNLYNPSASTQIILPDASRTERSLKDYYNQQSQMNQQKLMMAQQRQKMFLDYTDVTPIQTIMAQHQADQVVKIEEFYEGAKQKMSKGRLTTTDWMEMKQAMNGLESWQKTLQANQNMYIQAKATRAKESWKYSDKSWDEAEQDFLKNPMLFDIEKAMTPSAGNLTTAFDKIIDEIATQSREEIEYNDDQTVKSRTWVKAPIGKIAEQRAVVRERALADPKLVYDAILKFREFMEDNPKGAQKYLDDADTNNNGLNAKEEKNGIMDYALDTFAKFKPVIESKTSRAEQKTPPSGFTISIGTGGGKHKNYYNPGQTAGAFINGKKGVNFVTDNMNDIPILSSGLIAEPGVVLPKAVSAVVVNAADGEVEFRVKGFGIKKYELDPDTGERKKYTSSDIRKLKESDASVKSEPAGKENVLFDPLKPEEGSSPRTVFYVYTTPSSIPAKGDLGTYIDVIANSSSSEGVLDKEQILLLGGKQQKSQKGMTDEELQEYIR
ncbi:MAG TPA: hypothetical protein VMV86_04185 [Methanosarcinales archaeon]|nr:hypothetical protein [Methanosarcinales archaeon]